MASPSHNYEWSDCEFQCVVVQSVFVMPEFRRQGIFSKMYNHIRELAEEQDVAGLRLYVETKKYKGARKHTRHLE